MVEVFDCMDGNDEVLTETTYQTLLNGSIFYEMNSGTAWLKVNETTSFALEDGRSRSDFEDNEKVGIIDVRIGWTFI
ncbi:MAG: hypothetical protein J6J23_05635 [Clostridia bacterium]|nr:hypothetical protein [Clostridia bacterium]